MANLPAPEQGTGTDAPQGTNSALVDQATVLQQGPLLPYTFITYVSERVVVAGVSSSAF